MPGKNPPHHNEPVGTASDSSSTGLPDLGTADEPVGTGSHPDSRTSDSAETERAGKEKISPPEQRQPEPGLDQELKPKADHGERSYQGRDRLAGKRARITGGDLQ